MAPDLHTMTGAYALYALEPDERVNFEEHLAQCHACQQEVEELRATAVRLGAAEQLVPAPRVKAGLLAEIARTRQLPPLRTAEPGPTAAVVSHPRRFSRWGGRLAVPAMVASVTAALTFGVIADRADRRADQAAAQHHAMVSLLSAADLRTVTSTTTGGGFATVLVSRSRDTVLFTAGRLPNLPTDRRYQLWFIGTSGARSAGMLDQRIGEPVLCHGVGTAGQLGVTVEPATGSTQPTSAPMLVTALPV